MAHDISEANPFRQTLKAALTSPLFKKIFTGALKATMQAGVFGKKGVSNRVWDLRDQNYLYLKRLTAAGIADGKSAAAISREIRTVLVQPKTLRGRALATATPGPGIYRSAYKNAMRLTRTEANRAFVNAGLEFAREKELKVIWNVSTGQREEDECDELNGKVMTPDEFADLYPVHPACLCYSTYVIHDVPEGPVISMEPPAEA